MEYKKIGDITCPVCGGKTIQTRTGIMGRITASQNYGQEATWQCMECGSAFYAQKQGKEIIYRSIETNQQSVSGIDLLGKLSERNIRGW